MNFGEKKTEHSHRQNKDLPVWQMPKYLESKKKAIEIIESGKYGVTEADFWILMNETKNEKMAYSGLIISHNGCLKINDALESKFDPSSVSEDKDGWGGSLVIRYCNPAQGIYEYGEVSPKNCKNDYPYAMAFKRLFDRVVLKLSKIAYAGIYSEAESDEFKQPTEPYDPAKEVEVNDAKPEKKPEGKPKAVRKAEEDLAKAKVTSSNVTALFKRCEAKKIPIQKILDAYQVTNAGELTVGQWMAIMKRLESK